MKSWVVHYKNKYPDSRVVASDNSLDVYLKDGTHAVSIVKNGAGQWADQSAEMGCRDRHDLAPIPKDSRVHKVVEGVIGYRKEASTGAEIPVMGPVIGFDDKAEERKAARQKFMHEGRVLSCDELKKHGFLFCDKQNVLKEGAVGGGAKESPKKADKADAKA